jgi:hypothetical protein
LTQLAIGLGLALFPKQIRQLGDIRHNPSRLILRQQLRSCSPVWIIRIINVGKLLTVSVAYDVVLRLDFGGPGWWEAARGGHILKRRPSEI